ncbi:hypothetical protein T459_07173 [Capsicum annuum]|uniref:Ubiquitin-like protease family profile domain-containing protein n=1 Tax=Capsicum annuum TaxID=4072 RepID=A0A2G3ACZ0_CAPAN|nr:hypothetical protein T459_07173 [Capsicum annuum]
MNVMFKDNGKVVFKNIEPTKKELAKLQIPQKDAIQHERSVDSDDDFQDPLPRKINEHSKKKQKVDSSTLAAKKPLRKKQLNIVDQLTQTRTPASRAAKSAGTKTPIFKPIPTRRASSSKMKKGKQTAQVIFPQVQSKPDNYVEEVAVSKPHSHVDKEAFIFKKDFDAFCDEQQHADKDPDLQNMAYVGTKKSPQRLSSEVDQELEASLLGTKGCTDLHSEKMNVEINSQQLIPDELLRSINLDYLYSDKVVQHDCRTSDEKIDEISLSDSQFTIPNEMLPSLNAYRRQSIIIHPSANRQEESHHEILDAKTSDTVIEDQAQHIDVCFYYLRKKSKYGPHSSYKNEPNKSYKYSTVDCKFMNVIRSLMDVYSMDHQNINAGGQQHHLSEYINGFRMHAAMPWHTVENIFIPVNMKEKHHWVLAVLSFSERCIFLYDSYESSGHYVVVLAKIEKIAKIISLCLQGCDFYVKIGIDLQNHPRYKDKDYSDMFDVLFEDDLP